MRRLVLLILILAVSIGATKAGDDKTTLDTCKLHFMDGVDTATNNDDLCPSVSSPDQDGENDPPALGGITCTSSEIPAFLKSTQRSCTFDGVNNAFGLDNGDIQRPKTIAMWVYPTTDTTSTLFDHLWASVGIRFRLVNCGTDKLKVFLLVGGGFSNESACDTVPLNEWTFIAMGWSGNGASVPKLYTSGTANENTLLDSTENAPVASYGDPGFPMQFGKAVFDVEPFEGNISNATFLFTVLSEGGMCSQCRGGTGNLYRNNGVTGWEHDAIDLCNDCLFADSITHVGPRRVIN